MGEWAEGDEPEKTLIIIDPICGSALVDGFGDGRTEAGGAEVLVALVVDQPVESLTQRAGLFHIASAAYVHSAV